VSAPALILVADDDQVARDLLAEVLRADGYEILLAAGGKEALRLS
jgi:CheY-like chemotaxis protein